MKYSPTYSGSSESYYQCGHWGGYAHGINCWAYCNGNPNINNGGEDHRKGYTNVVVTHRNPRYPEHVGIYDNPTGQSQGGSSSTYGNDVLLWVK